ncbi:unnamed protein product [Vitrella brassicaformis CCMP3155]|uniref:Ion transport domain-containing protein n=1 Tax=Vitrella brassicaformis (strain CCMP3155) TaxID=1169540 RepID=A0A0G4F9X8_VITBC|nr:unnamed protein product [Vitrella brassicaformis CCMP3155]|mmetsp:Transcript_22488/g.64290  ORF Transcript_22488/g.64290 Transcript_22488/m.64290 type:complete len:326 (+) Transcript_22488:45-1022(+)|eukprot:CEM09175.1 unnamed protein product [Vitrella brassicaformis CCMP3155]
MKVRVEVPNPEEERGSDLGLRNKAMEDDEIIEHIEPPMSRGKLLEKVCFTQRCLIFQIALNILLAVLNTAMVFIDIILIQRENRHNLNQPSTRLIEDILCVGDITITSVILVEFVLKLQMADWGARQFFKSWEHILDALVLLISFVCIGLAYVQIKKGADVSEAELALALRVITVRDIMRIVRTVYFLIEINTLVTTYRGQHSPRSQLINQPLIEAYQQPNHRDFCVPEPPEQKGTLLTAEPPGPLRELSSNNRGVSAVSAFSEVPEVPPEHDDEVPAVPSAPTKPLYQPGLPRTLDQKGGGGGGGSLLAGAGKRDQWHTPESSV